MSTLFTKFDARWSRVLSSVALLSALGLVAAPAAANNALAVKTLVEQARFWEGKGRSDLAVAAWKRLLQVDPGNTDALTALAQFEVDNNRPEAAKAYIDQLKVKPAVTQDAVRRIEGAIAMKSVNADLLERARGAAKGGRIEESVKLYRQIFDGQPAQGPLALEFYQTLGGTSSGWDEARRGLASLAQAEPSNHMVGLAYGQHLTYRAATRREGIRLLSQLADQPQVAQAATESWRKALIWLEASRSDTSLFQAYLKFKPNDAAIQARISSLNQVFAPKPLDPKIIALRDGFKSLNIGDVADAEKRFQALLASGPRNPDAMGGMGVVRLKQERFAEAERLLSDALRYSGNRKWEEALNSARFWLALELGDQAASSGDVANARIQYEKAARLDSTQERPYAALADLLVEEGRLLDAERTYRRALEVYPKSLDLRRGLAGVLVRQGKVDEALVLAEGLSEAERDELGYGSLRAEQYRLRAVQLMARGDSLGAMQQLEEALLWDPNSPWLRLELARLYHKSGATNEAFGLMDGLLQTQPDMPDALHAAALMSAEAKEWTLALSMLERIPVKTRTRAMSELQRRLWVQAQVVNAQALSKAGHTPQAAALLDQAKDAAGTDAELLAVVAQGMLELGDEARSMALMRSLLAQTPQPAVGLMVQYAGLLLKTRQDVELAAQLRQLYTQPLSAEQRVDLDTIRWAYSIRQIDAQREAGNFSASYEIAAQLLREKPTDVSVQQALARLYSSAGEHALALSWYNQILQTAAPDVPTLVAASGSALAAGELAYAQSALDMAAGMAPSDPAVLSAMGRLARARGNNRQAVELLQQAQQVTLAQANMQRIGPLGVNLVDYTLPPPAPSALGGASASRVPPIPNPLGGRLVNPSAQPRPLMQPTGPMVQPPSDRLVPYSQVPQAPLPMAAQPSSALAATADQRAMMRPVQYQLPRRDASVFDAPSAQQPTYPAGPQLAPVGAQPAAAYPGYPAQQPAPWSGGYYPAQPAPTAYPATAPYPAGATYPQNYPVNYQQPEPTYREPAQQPASAAALPLNYPPTSQRAPVAPLVAQRSLPAEPLAPAGWTAPTPIGRGASAPGSLQREIDELRADRAGQASGGGLWRNRGGDAGTTELTDFSTTIETRFPLAQSGHLVLRMEPVFLSAGRISSTDFNSSQQFGTNALVNVSGGLGTIREQQDSGVAFSIGYETARLKLDLGTTPLGFEVQNMVGGLAYNDSLGDLKVKLDLSRRAVTDSLLSYAGTVDDVSGKSWGGVTATGGRLELGVEEGPFGLYGYGGMHWLRGRNVVDNSRFEVGGGTYYKFIKNSDMELTAGVSVTALGYKRNLRYFTLGHGGYFSPQRYFSLSLPVEVAGRTGKLAYRVDGSIGIQNFRENSAAYFPGDDTRQANWETVATANSVAAPTGVTWRSFYPGQSKTGLGFRLGGEAEYRFAPQWAVGGKLSVDNASDYTQASGMVFVRYHFDPVYTPIRFPPSVLKVGQ